MDKFVIEGGVSLKGEIKISAAKNAVLPIMAACLLTEKPCRLKNVPNLKDIEIMTAILRSLGANVEKDGDGLVIEAKRIDGFIADYSLVSTMRGSFCVLGPLLARFKKARVSYPGGCAIGVRPVDLHIKGLKALGADIRVESGYVVAEADKLQGTHLYLGGMFGSSVLATMNVMMAAILAQGKTIIESAACEPEVEDLGNFLNAIGAQVKGHGTPRIEIEGVKELHGAEYEAIPDRIEAATFMIAALITNGEIRIENVVPKHLVAVMDVLGQAGAHFGRRIEDYEGKTANSLTIKLPGELNPVNITALPYPGFPTDVQAQMMSLMSLAKGTSIITDKVFPDRFMHVAELNRLAAHIQKEGQSAIIEGVSELSGADVMASDLRASASLVLAGLAAKGQTTVFRIYHLDRGYANLEQKLQSLGAKVKREKE